MATRVIRAARAQAPPRRVDRAGDRHRRAAHDRPVRRPSRSAASCSSRPSMRRARSSSSSIVAIVLAMAAEPLVQALRATRPAARRRGRHQLRARDARAGRRSRISSWRRSSTRRGGSSTTLRRSLQQLADGDGRLGFLEERFHVVERARAAVESGRLAAAAGPAWDVVDSAVRTGGAIVFVAFLTLFVQLGGRQWFDSLVDLAPESGRAAYPPCRRRHLDGSRRLRRREPPDQRRGGDGNDTRAAGDVRSVSDRARADRRASST